MASDHRPDPDALLAMVREEEREGRGRLRVFFGAAPGVGKTFAMLEEALARKREGMDVVAGIVETHGRSETAALLSGIECLARAQVAYKGMRLAEFDLDAALARRPSLILVDELAHTNAPGSRHDKRWQDVRELLAAGIDVYTTVNVQHLESLNDVVAQITQVRVRETVPDVVLEEADAIVLVDLPPDDLLRRLSEGKVYVPKQAEWAVQHYFQAGNLIALRELALRFTAERVNRQVQVYRHGKAIDTTWPTSERILVSVGPSPTSAKLIRAAKRMASGLQAPWIAAYVETARQADPTDPQHESAMRNLRLAEQLGAEVVTVSGTRVAEEIVTLARDRNVTKIIAGKPIRPRWRDALLGSPVDELIRLSGEIDVYVISGDRSEDRPTLQVKPRQRSQRGFYAYSLLISAACTVLAWGVAPYLQLSNLIMVYLLGVVLSAMYLGRGPSLLCSCISVLAFDFFFVPPRFTLAVSDTQYLVTFAVMLLVALVISHLTGLARLQAEAARHQARVTAAMHSLSRELALTRGTRHIVEKAVRRIADLFGGNAVAFLPGEGGRLQPSGDGLPAFEAGSAGYSKDLSVAEWVFANGEAAGHGTQTLPTARATFIPLQGVEGVVGVLGLLPADPSYHFSPDQFRIMDAFAKQTALALEVERLGEASAQARMETEKERLRTSLLSSVTHDLQTPLAAIMGSADSLLAAPEPDPGAVRAMAGNIYSEAERLSRLLTNLLRMTRLESGACALNKEPLFLEEVVGAALNRVEPMLGEREVEVDIPADLPMIPMDGMLMEQLFINLIENGLKYTSAGTPIRIAARRKGNAAEIEVADRGPGLPPEDTERVFDMFYKGAAGKEAGGHGLGLSICRAIVQAHGGMMRACNREGGGATFVFTLPVDAEPAMRASA